MVYAHICSRIQFLFLLQEQRLVCVVADGNINHRLDGFANNDAYSDEVETSVPDVVFNPCITQCVGIFQVCQLLPVELERDGRG